MNGRLKGLEIYDVNIPSAELYGWKSIVTFGGHESWPFFYPSTIWYLCRHPHNNSSSFLKCPLFVLPCSCNTYIRPLFRVTLTHSCIPHSFTHSLTHSSSSSSASYRRFWYDLPPFRISCLPEHDQAPS